MDLYITLTHKSQAAADDESAKVYPWLVKEIGNKGLPSRLFDATAFLCHEIANNRFLRNSLTRQIKLRVKVSETEIVIAIRYDGEPFNDLNPQSGPRAIQGIINEMNAIYRDDGGEDVGTDAGSTATAGETFYTTTRIILPIAGKK